MFDGRCIALFRPNMVKPSRVKPNFIINQKASASIAPPYSKGRPISDLASNVQVLEKVLLTREMLESKLGELLGYRYQASGKVFAYVTRKWKPISLSSNFILKIRDCMPDSLSPSTFVRFAIWDNGSSFGEFGEPIRMSHFLNCFYTKNLASRGSKLLS